MWPSSEACCFGAFKDSCTRLPKSKRPCWVVDSFYPARLCRQSTTLCGKQAKGKRSIPTLGLAGVMHRLSLFEQSNPARSIFKAPVQPFPGPAVCSCSSNFHLLCHPPCTASTLPRCRCWCSELDDQGRLLRHWCCIRRGLLPPSSHSLLGR